MFKYFKFSPIWTLAGVVLPALMIVASQWQWSRYEEKLALVETYKTHESSSAIKFSGRIIEDDLYKKHSLKGVYDYDNQFALRNRKSGYGVGFHLFTPLKISPSLAVFVSRGFIPYEDREPSDWRKYSFTPGEEVEIQAVLQPSVDKKSWLSPSNPETAKNQDWEHFFLFPELDLITKQYPYEVVSKGYFQRLGPPPAGTFPEEAVSIRVPPSTHYWYSYEWLLLAFLTFSCSLIVQMSGKKIEEKRRLRAEKFEANARKTLNDF